MKKRILSLALCLALALSMVAFAGCKKEEPQGTAANETTGASDTKGSVYWLNRETAAKDDLEALAQTYTQQTGVTVKVVTPDTYEDALTAEMGQPGAPTLFALGSKDDLAAWGESCYDLTGASVYNERTTDAFTLGEASGKICAIGYGYDCFGIIVNKALLRKTGYDLSAIRDFTSMKIVARDIHARSAEWGIDAFAPSTLDESSAMRYAGQLANMALFYECRDDGWTACPDKLKGTYMDGFRNAFDMYVQNAAVKPDMLTTGKYDAKEAFISGKAVFYLGGAEVFDDLVAGGIPAEDLAMIPIYCNVAGEEKAGLCSNAKGFWAVNGQSSQADIKATLDFMHWMVTSPEGTEVMRRHFGAVPYKNAGESENVFYNDAASYLSAGNYVVDWTFNYTPKASEWRAGVISALADYCNGGEWNDVRVAFVTNWAVYYKLANMK